MQIAPHAFQALERQCWFGLGQCRRCSCQAFKGAGNICEDCGRHYDDHTTKLFRSAVVGRAITSLQRRNDRAEGWADERKRTYLVVGRW